MATSINSSTKAVGKLFENLYFVPDFQRDYSWNEEKVKELWSDITKSIDENREHFLGAIVVSNENGLMLIDGQQRIVTLSLLMCVIRDILLIKKEEQRAQEVSSRYLGSLDLETLTKKSKLTLNELNNDFYQDNFITPETVDSNELQRNSGKRSTHKSNKLIATAYLLIRKEVESYISKLDGDEVKSLLKIEKCVREKLIIIEIMVNDLASAFLIFETLNDRGLALSVADLLKNHLFSKSGNRLQDVKSRWKEMSANLGNTDSTRFIRHYWISEGQVVRKKDLYRTVSEKISQPQDVVKLVTKLRDGARIYGALEDPSSSIWDEYNSDVKANIETLKLFQVNLCYPVLLAAYQSLPLSIFPQILKMIVVITFRYNTICDFSTSELENIYSDAAKYIRENKTTSIKDIFYKGRLARIYPKDDEFKKSFSQKAVKQSALARYILRNLNDHYNQQSELITNHSETKLNLEHILPENPNENWRDVLTNIDDVSEYIYRLGNLTLLGSAQNRKAGNSSFEEKCSKFYSVSNLEITKEIASNNGAGWGPKQIEDRQSRMAKKACQIWRLDY
jgi:hypothetical protein